jgi:hypothetical protein
MYFKTQYSNTPFRCTQEIFFYYSSAAAHNTRIAGGCSHFVPRF